ncbi:DUF4198 domain-containing protein [Novosphingobium album (ex Hu et al. 2023)]|uniref:DUF4198 domain-containing protein n=1 Tax=Novosphingobium album (ex Hu et al. 2023) TaxID=2930093 RepID=A0ABT0AZU3_9SPHN|nr:DUF4198 domain-containing protein [Novosphingobium album (ex Hu et al. 2023)]MCJ2178302.1 DUF4198 domain-containing protein [Novosphingobium album (ex Hu et al. 2023)]
MRFNSLLAATAAVCSAIATPALAHSQWLLPSTTILSGTGNGVTVDAGASTSPFFADHVAMNLDDVKVWEADGTEGKIDNPARGRYRSTFDVMVDKPGTWKIGVEQSSVSGSFMLDGEMWRVGSMRGRPPMGAGLRPGAPGGEAPGGRPGQGGPGGPPPEGGRGRFDPAHVLATPADIPANATDVKLSERISRNFIFVTADAPTMTVFKPVGKGLEMEPITHPGSLVADEEGQFRFLVDGKPAAGVAVTVVPGGKRFREAEEAQELKTGADGVLHVKWPIPGMYWLSAELDDHHPGDPRAAERRMSYTTTLEVVAP